MFVTAIKPTTANRAPMTAVSFTAAAIEYRSKQLKNQQNNWLDKGIIIPYAINGGRCDRSLVRNLGALLGPVLIPGANMAPTQTKTSSKASKPDQPTAAIPPLHSVLLFLLSV